MIKWFPWPPNFSKKFQVNLTIHNLEGFSPVADKMEDTQRFMIDVKWKGPRGGLGLRFRRCLKRGRTSDKVVAKNGIITWDEDFGHECVLLAAKNSSFQPWVVHFVVLQAIQRGTKTHLSVRGTAIMDLAEFVSVTNISSQTIRIRVSCSVDMDTGAALIVSVKFIQLHTIREGLDSVLRIMAPSLPCIGGFVTIGGKRNKQLKEGTGKRILQSVKSHAIVLNGKKNSGELYMSEDDKIPPIRAESLHNSGDLFASDSVDELDSDEAIEGCDCSFRKSFGYGTLAGANLFVEGALPYYRDDRGHGKFAQNILSVNSRTVVESIPKLADELSTSDLDQTIPSQTTMLGLLYWKKRKLSFRSPRARGQPLLNKAYGEDGGDDIDYDRRQSGSPIEPASDVRWKNKDNMLLPTVSGYLDFGDEHFSVGSWEMKELVSRDGQMKLLANVFFASIDQRSERAAGASACTVLVAVMADWLHRNPNRMPIRAEFDTLIREGSAEWRRLCEIESYKDRFPDCHFDLDTVLQAGVRPLSVAPQRSFIGFFQPEGLGNSCDFLQGAMSFENIWDEIVSIDPGENFEPAVYIVSWNDHFFVLKVEGEAFYLIDTLGERLYEGCDLAYILRFDKEASLCQVPKMQSADDKDPIRPHETAVSSSGSGSQQIGSSCGDVTPGEGHPQQKHRIKDGQEGTVDLPMLETFEERVFYKGKEACKQFVKGFFAALPLRELQTDIKKGLTGKAPLHRHLQIEFHYTSLRPLSADIGSQ